MKKITLFIFLIVGALGAEYTYKSYISLQGGKTKIKRDYSVHMKKDGIFLNKETGEIVNGRKGKTYSFKEELEDKKSVFIYGVQKGDFGNFYEIGYSSGDDLDEFSLSLGFTFPDTFSAKTWINPYLKLIGGVGYTDGDFPNPTSYTYGLGLGFLTTLSDSLKLNLGVDLKKRFWLDIGHSYGQEQWSDKEGTGFLGVRYSF